MRGAGMVVESAKGECNFGQHEIAFRYAELVDKADEHSLFKLGAKEIAAQEGCSLTFMAKYDEREGNSCHVHLSLRDDAGEPVFAGTGAHGFSEVFEHFLAGLLAACPGAVALPRTERQQLQALRVRLVRADGTRLGAGQPDRAPFGSSATGRRCASRPGSPAATSTRTSRSPRSSRRVCAASRTTLPLAGRFEGNAHGSDAPRMPTSLAEALALFEESAVARTAFSDEVVEHYAHAARVELAAFGSAVTDWERYRGFERL